MLAHLCNHFLLLHLLQPVVVENMNYTCVVVGALPILILAWWFVAGGKYKNKISAAKEE